MLNDRDDFRHPLSGPFARESIFYNLLLPDEGLTSFLYTWVDQQDRAGLLVTVFTDDRQPLAVETAEGVAVGAADFDDWTVGGLTVRHSKPMEVAELVFSGDQALVELTFEALHRPFSYAEGPEGCPPALAHDRFEQSGRVHGTISVAGRSIAFDTTAHRDHSWGTRDWDAFHHWKWISGQAGRDTTFNAFHLLAGDRQWINGYINRGGEVIPLVGVRAETTYDDDFTQRRASIELTDAAGSTTHLEAERFALTRFPAGEAIVLHEAGCKGTVDGAPGLIHYEMGWNKDYVAGQAQRRSAGGTT